MDSMCYSHKAELWSAHSNYPHWAKGKKICSGRKAMAELTETVTSSVPHPILHTKTIEPARLPSSPTKAQRICRCLLPGASRGLQCQERGLEGAWPIGQRAGSSMRCTLQVLRCCIVTPANGRTHQGRAGSDTAILRLTLSCQRYSVRVQLQDVGDSGTYSVQAQHLEIEITADGPLEVSPLIGENRSFP